MDKSTRLEKTISFLLFTGLLLNLFFLYFDQERLYRKASTGSIALGPERYIRIISVIFIFITVILSLFAAKLKYHFSIYVAYLILLVTVSANYFISGASIFDMTQFMSNRGIGTYICLGLIFVGFHDKRFEFFKKFLFFSVCFIALLIVYNLLDYGVGMWRGQALSKYQIYAVNLVWLSPYVFLVLKNNKKLRWLRFFAIGIGIIVALICQTRSFLLIYFITLIFDFFNTKKKGSYLILSVFGFLGLAYLIMNTKMFSSSLELLMNRGTNDTRSEQLGVFISQLDFFELITGGGFFTSYGFGDKQWIAVDNQWLYLFWWGGLIPLLCYFYLSAVIPIKVIFKGGLSYETKVECFTLIIWVLGLAGLAIYSTMSVDFFFFTITILLGRVLYKFSSGQQ